MKRILKYLGLSLLILLLGMFVKTLFTQSLQPKVAFIGPGAAIPGAEYRLAQVLRFQTISAENNSLDSLKHAQLELLFTWMYQAYPLVFKNSTVTAIGDSRLIEIKGQDPKLLPALMLAHLDVVPADTGITGHWKFPPFSGTISQDTVYGRGALDDKSVATAMLEALEDLLKSGKKPRRTIMLAFGHDEEIGGQDGAKKIAAYLSAKGIKAEFICDEGFGVMENLVPGVQNNVALIGVAEKGFVSAELTVAIPGGHSSMPKADNATAILTKGLAAVENTTFLEELCAPQQGFFRHIAPEASPLYRFLFSNLWMSAPAVKMVLRGNNKTAATMRTTHATTIIQAGDKENVMPGKARAVINFRILPGQTIEEVKQHLIQTLDEPRIAVRLLPDQTAPSDVSPDQGAAWDAIVKSIHQTYKNVVTAPALVIAGTDCKHYTAISANIYRFVPLRLNSQNLEGIHGSDEKIALRNYQEAIGYYRLLFSNI